MERGSTPTPVLEKHQVDASLQLPARGRDPRFRKTAIANHIRIKRGFPQRCPEVQHCKLIVTAFLAGS